LAVVDACSPVADLGGVELVENEVPVDEIVRKVDWTHLTLPVPAIWL
jgi:hypothetical protein